MAKELAHFKNFAKLKDTQVAFNDITVIAGKPGTGKSYVMKFQYAYDETVSSINNGAYKMHYALMNDGGKEQHFFNMIKPLVEAQMDETLNKLLDDNNYIQAEELFNIKLKKILENNSEDKAFLEAFHQSLQKFSKRQKKSLEATEEEKFHFIFRNILESIFTSLDQIDTEFLYENNKLAINYNDGELKLSKLDIQKSCENAIFVETPLIIEFEKFLPSERFKTPYHIDSLLQELNKTDFSFTSDEISNFINEFKKSTQKIVNGNISKGTHGFSFESDNGKTYDIVNASSGTKSIGLLQYLVTNKALKKGSVLYWEEPEVHLHPEWQLKMIELFIELMNAGVKIVFSTHSTFMVDSLNALSKKEGFSDRVSFNLFKETDGIVENHILEADEEWKLIQDELLKSSLEEIMWQYL